MSIFQKCPTFFYGQKRKWFFQHVRGIIWTFLELRVNLQSDLNQKRCKIKIKIWGYFRVLKVTKVSSFRGSQRCLTKGQRHFQNVQAASHMAPASPLRRQGNVKLVKVIKRQTPQPFNHACRHPHPDHPSRSSTSSPRSWSMRRAPGTSRCPAPRDESSEIIMRGGRGEVFLLDLKVMQLVSRWFLVVRSRWCPRASWWLKWGRRIDQTAVDNHWPTKAASFWSDCTNISKPSELNSDDQSLRWDQMNIWN